MKDSERCLTCEGYGWVTKDGRIFGDDRTCPGCNGTGRRYRERIDPWDPGQSEFDPLTGLAF